jgi:hypothetical protein
MGMERVAGWVWQHEHQAALVARDGWMCEAHPGTAWPHDDCAGPGMPWVVEGRESIQALAAVDPVGVSAANGEAPLADHARKTERVSDDLGFLYEVER